MYHLKTIAEKIKAGNNFLVMAHVSPDGDAIGSMNALGCILDALGKNFMLVNPDGLPQRFSWLDIPWGIHKDFQDFPYDWCLVLDCADMNRLGGSISAKLDRQKTINIDHHLGNSNFGLLNWVEPERSSVGEMIFLLARELEVPVSQLLGESIYLAIVTDTGSFSYSNTTPQSLQITAQIIQAGIDPAAVNAQMQRQWTLNKLHLHGMAMQNVHLFSQDRIGVIKVPLHVMHETGTSLEDCEGLVNYVRLIKGVLVALSLREVNANQVKFSLRSWGEVDVRTIAEAFGGGGHHNASGGTLNTSLDQAERIMIRAIEPSLS